MSISISSEVLGTLSVTVAETTGVLSVSVLATAPAVLTMELGTPGPSPTITVGTTTTLAPGSPATVTDVGTALAAVFDFGIPQGTAGTAGTNGTNGTNGTAATIAAGTTTTLSPGSSATVTNAGTSSAAVFNFGIPQGTAGTAGATGATGATGAAGVGVPVGGSTGQLLTKVSATNYDTTWTTVIPGDRYLTTSVTSNSVSNGNKTFTIGTGLSYTPTQNLTISFDASNHMHGEVLTYNSGTGVLTVDINHHTGSGTYTSWVVNVGGVTPATSVAWGDITGTLSTQTDLQTALDDKLPLAGGTMDAAATIVLSTATYNSLVSGEVFGVELTADPTQNASLGFNAVTVQDGAGTMQMRADGLTFPDATTQSTAGLTISTLSNGATSTLNAGVPSTEQVLVFDGTDLAWHYPTVSCGSIGWTLSSQMDLQTELDNKASLTSPAFGGTTTFVGAGGTVSLNDQALDMSASTAGGHIIVGTSGVTFSDSTTQTTAAVAPPSADVMTANAIAANVQSIGYGASNWVGSSNPSIAGLVGWGIYNATDGLIAYSYSSGNSFFLASTPTTLANSSVQVNGSNSSFYVA